ncbi:PP2C family protein-serine/threonine phosphatase [Novosphingobium pentaromativorans]|uniref:Stage II sporulation E family protein n=1 Tax=Novosphingobium pentaromativorans US6-1 TaxID=1088721 RepID=G6E8C2_9SPHN|nr:PP2C family protein-serine/threonine phosphatase [Novosphingobium pentaromativorans]AIT81389.1 stage II sporulation protein E [Novosphingobium pentaromativorans US6-1]EHJ62462.1 stage II sporulation E family protein [Novosphingobium pentaromativorans US6-1]
MDGAQRVRRFGLKPQLLLLLFVLNLVSATVYTAVLYSTDRHEILTGIDGKLQTATNAVREIIPDGYHRRIRDAKSVTPDEYRQIQQHLSRFGNASGLTYVYTYMKFGDDIRTVATSATDGEIAQGSETKFFTLYDTAPDKLYRSFADGRVRFDEYSDSFGRFRSIYMPVKSPDGRVHVIGADIDLTWLDERLHMALVKSIAIGIALFALSMAVGWFLVSRIVEPLVRLTTFTRNMETRSFRPDEDEMDAMRKISRDRGDEVGSLAEAMAGMIARLQRYLVEVAEATAARERVEGELSAARDIQIGMLPRKFPPFPDRTDLDVFALLEPAKQVGGDLYDYFLIDRNRLFFVVGDVSGKGVPAALFMAMTTTLFKAHAMSGGSTGQIMERVNAELSRDNAAEMFVTVFAGILDLRSGEVEYSDGGHEAPFIVRADGSVERLAKQQGMALGVFEDVPFRTGHFNLREGDALVLFTDGVSEATGANDELFTTARIADALASARAEFSARLIAEGLAQSVRGFVGAVPQSDDIAILTVCYEGARETVSPA